MKDYLLNAIPDKELNISNISISDEDYRSGNPYNTIFFMKIRSGDFSGSGFFELDIADLCTFARELNSLHSTLSGSTILKDIGYGSFIEFNTISKHGHIKVNGEIYGESKFQKAVFEFQIDQTDLSLFCKNIYSDFGSSEEYAVKAIHNKS